MLGIPAGTFLTSNETAVSPALTEDKKYELLKIAPMYRAGSNPLDIRHTEDPSAGPLSYFEVTIKEDDRGKKLSTPACHFRETSDILFAASQQS